MLGRKKNPLFKPIQPIQNPMTYQTQQRLEALILLALREMQGQDPALVSYKLRKYYGVTINPEAIASEIDDLCESINSDDRELIAF